MVIVLSDRERLYAEVARLSQIRADLDPASAAYAARSLEIDAVLCDLWALGPVDV